MHNIYIYAYIYIHTYLCCSQMRSHPPVACISTADLFSFGAHLCDTHDVFGKNGGGCGRTCTIDVIVGTQRTCTKVSTG